LAAGRAGPVGQEGVGGINRPALQQGGTVAAAVMVTQSWF
jgi:hypothetical protein